MPIWDLHCHLTPALRGANPAEKAAHLIETGGRLGIERFCVYMGLEWSRDPNPSAFPRENDDILQAVAAHPDRLFGFVYLNPKHTQTCLDELKRCVQDGPMVGIKLWVAHRCSAPELNPIVERALELKIPIFQHTWLKTSGNLPGESTPDDLAELARRFPTAPLICGHTGGNWERGLRAIRDLPNVSIDLAGSDPTAGFVEMAYREVGPDRIIYGSDAPGRSFASQLAKVTGARIPDGREKILSDNLRRLLEPALKLKGITL